MPKSSVVALRCRCTQPVSPLTASATAAAASATAAAADHAHRHVLRLRCGLLDVHLLAGDRLLGRLQQLVDHLLRVECDEAEALALVLLLVERHLNVDDLHVVFVCFGC